MQVLAKNIEELVSTGKTEVLVLNNMIYTEGEVLNLVAPCKNGTKLSKKAIIKSKRFNYGSSSQAKYLNIIFESC